MKTKELRQDNTARVARLRRTTLERRQRLADEFRGQLRVELPNATAAQSALLDVAASAHLQVQELGARYLRGRASPSDTTKLSLARGQQARILRQLGLAGAPAEPQDVTAPPLGASAEEKREWSRKYVSGVLAEAATK
jgi:hypothetical protein